MKNVTNHTKKTSQQLPQDDVVDFLKEKKGGVVTKFFNWRGPLRSRALAFLAMLKGYFSFSEFCKLLLPLSSGKKLELIDRYNVFLCDEYKKAYHISPDNCVNIFGHKFRIQNCYNVAIELVRGIIVGDQYYANQFIKKDSVIIDAGAHIGIFSVLAAHLAPQGHIYSFEPAAETFQVLKKNAEYYPQIICVNSGLGDEISQKNIFVDSKRADFSAFQDSPFYAGKYEDRKSESANVLTIDAFIMERGITRIDFIKIDTEGYEAKILRGARESIKKWKPVVAMSAYHNPNDKEDLPRIIKEICPDYICELHKDHEEDFICYIKEQ